MTKKEGQLLQPTFASVEQKINNILKFSQGLGYSILEIRALFVEPHIQKALLVAILNNLVVITTEIETKLCIAPQPPNQLKRLCSKDYSPLRKNILVERQLKRM